MPNAIRLVLSLSPMLFFMVYSQLISKWRLSLLAHSMLDSTDIISRFIIYLKDPFILSSYVAALAGSVGWIFVVERYSVALAFPVYIGLTIIFVNLGSLYFLSETISMLRIYGICILLIGVAIVAAS
jgi:multidrug transporter EmrE-like cation transporter